MKYVVLGVTKHEIKEGDRKGEPYFNVECKEADPMVTRTIKFPILPTSEIVIEWWEETAAQFEAGNNSRLKTVNVGRFIIGDPSVNPNDTPLPPFQLKNSQTDEFGAVSTSMTVHVLLDSEGKPRLSPRKEALRIIERIGRFVDSHVSAEPDENPPM
jgi:hypothetical protein